MGPNKDVTNIDNEIQEAEEFLNEDQMSLIRSIVVDDPLLKSIPAENLTKINPTLRSLGFAKNTRVSFNDELEINSDDDLSSDENSDDEFDDDDFDNDDGLSLI